VAEPSRVGADASGMLAQQASWSSLNAAAGAGTLRMEPGAAEECAVACEVLGDELAAQAKNLRRVTRLEGLGELDSGRALARKFEMKAFGEMGVSAIEVLQQHMAVLVEMAATFRAAGAAYRAQEQATADGLGGGMRAAVLAVLAVLALGGCVASSVAGSPVTSSGLAPVETINFDRVR